MNIMILGLVDIGGLGRHLKKYLERDGHKVFNAVYGESYVHPDADLIFSKTEGAGEILDNEAKNTDYFIIRWMFHPNPMMKIIKPYISPRNAMIKIHGTEAREHLFPEYERWWYMNLKYKNLPILAPFDMSILLNYKRRFLFHHIERPLDLEVFPKPKPCTEPYIVAAPTRPEKGVDFLLKTCKDIGNIKVGVIHDAEWTESLAQKADAGIGFDQLAPVGEMPRIYGLSSAEFWMLGKPCMTETHPSIYSLYPELKDIIIDVNRDNLFHVLNEYVSDPKIFTKQGQNGKKFVKKYHDARRIAKQYIAFMEMQMDGGLIKQEKENM